MTKSIEPYDLVKHDSLFVTEQEARGFERSIFLKSIKKYI